MLTARIFRQRGRGAGTRSLEAVGNAVCCRAPAVATGAMVVVCRSKSLTCLDTSSAPPCGDTRWGSAEEEAEVV